MQSNALTEKLLTSQVVNVLNKLVKLHYTVQSWTLNSIGFLAHLQGNKKQFAFDSIKYATERNCLFKSEA